MSEPHTVGCWGASSGSGAARSRSGLESSESSLQLSVSVGAMREPHTAGWPRPASSRRCCVDCPTCSAASMRGCALRCPCSASVHKEVTPCAAAVAAVGVAASPEPLDPVAAADACDSSSVVCELSPPVGPPKVVSVCAAFLLTTVATAAVTHGPPGLAASTVRTPVAAAAAPPTAAGRVSCG
eukprot:scaffold242987_cov14-Tisochrysis_lutea.AAC.1